MAEVVHFGDQQVFNGATTYTHKISSPFRGGYWSYGKRFIEQLPYLPHRLHQPDAARHDRMVILVERLLDLNKQLPEAALPYDRERLRRQIEATDRQIDDLVYELYGLTDEEIKLVAEAQA